MGDLKFIRIYFPDIILIITIVKIRDFNIIKIIKIWAVTDIIKIIKKWKNVGH